MKEKKRQSKNIQILTDEEMKELREFMPQVVCRGGKVLECPSGTKEWQKIGYSDNWPDGLRCDNQIQMCEGGEFSGSGSLGDSGSFAYICPTHGPTLTCYKDGHPATYDEIIYKPTNNPYEQPDIVGIRCGNEYKFCNNSTYPGGSSGSISGSGPWGKNDGIEDNLL